MQDLSQETNPFRLQDIDFELFLKIESITEIAGEQLETAIPTDLEEEMQDATENHQLYLLEVDGCITWLMWLPESRRAGLCQNAYSEWTFADSPADALERYFCVADKEMQN